jgi:ribosomal protein S18 acetylase RimI-like enzyme
MTYDGRRIHLHHFAISTEMQGKGWGRTLAIESLKFAVQVGCPVKLEVHRDNRRALQLYFSLGFREFEDYGVYMFLNPPLSHG